MANYKTQYNLHNNLTNVPVIRKSSQVFVQIKLRTTFKITGFITFNNSTLAMLVTC